MLGGGDNVLGHKLTAKQKKFADEYLKSGNATQAAIQAGYSKKTATAVGSENLTKPYIKAYINEKMQELESHKIADAKEVLQFFTRIMRGEEKHEVPIATAKEIKMIEVVPDFKEQLSAAKELIKRYPTSDREKAQLRKLLADTRISEAKANIAERLGNDDNLQLDELLDKLVSDSDKGTNK